MNAIFLVFYNEMCQYLQDIIKSSVHKIIDLKYKVENEVLSY